MDTKSRQSEPPAQSAPATVAPAAGRAAPASRTRGRVWTARCVALAADASQIALLPLVLGGALSPVSDVIDVTAAIVLTWLIGWHWAFLPTFVAEIVPFVDLVPTWTVAVFLATRGHRDRPTSS